MVLRVRGVDRITREYNRYIGVRETGIEVIGQLSLLLRYISLFFHLSCRILYREVGYRGRDKVIGHMVLYRVVDGYIGGRR